MRRIFLSLVFLTIGISAQESPKAVLVTEFGPEPCEFVLAQTRFFVEKLQQDPSATGYVKINPSSKQLRYQFGRRNLVAAALQLEGLEADRFRFFLGTAKDSNTQFWLVPAGAQIPTNGFAVFDEEKPDISKKVLFGSSEEPDICPTFVPRKYAKLLLDNPGSIGRIVIAYDRQSVNFRWGIAEHWVEKLVLQNKVPRNRLRIVFRKGTESVNTEFWFVPAKK